MPGLVVDGLWSSSASAAQRSEQPAVRLCSCTPPARLSSILQHLHGLRCRWPCRGLEGVSRGTWCFVSVCLLTTMILVDAGSRR